MLEALIFCKGQRLVYGKEDVIDLIACAAGFQAPAWEGLLFPQEKQATKAPFSAIPELLSLAGAFVLSFYPCPCSLLPLVVCVW